MNIIFFLRSYGDFIVAINSLRNTTKLNSFCFVASLHLKELFDSLPKNIVPGELQIVFYDFKIRHGILACFTDRFLISKTAVRELFEFRGFFKNKEQKFLLEDNENNFFLEQQRRAVLPFVVTGRKFDYLHSFGNIYDSYRHFFESNSNIDCAFNLTLNKPLLILIFPGSRRKDKEIPREIVDYLLELQPYSNVSIKCALLVKDKSVAIEDKRILHYSNFYELRDCILSADFIISSDSLPVHLCQLLGKPHWIMFNKKVNSEWLTPFTKKENLFCCFSEYRKLGSFIKEKYNNESILG